MTTTSRPQELRIISFGYLHDEPPTAHLTLDMRTLLRDPHVDPAFRELTGEDEAVKSKVRTTAGYGDLLPALIFTAFQLARIGGTTIAIGCAGGRHRSHVLAEDLAAALRYDLASIGIKCVVEHRDIHRPVVKR